MKMHFNTHGSAVACGRDIWPGYRTTNIDRVSCQRCKSSAAFQEAVRVAEAQRASAAAASVGETQAILDLVAKAAFEEAKDRGYCDTFDIIVEHVNSCLPHGLTLKRPARTYIVTIEVEASDEDDAFSKIDDTCVEEFSPTITLRA